MKIIDDLIDTLSQPGCAMEDALIRAQVLAHQLGDSEMAAWVKAELEGYPDDTPVPHYRSQLLTLTGTIGNGYYFYKNQTLPVIGLRDSLRDSLTMRNVRQGVGGIEHLAKKEDEGEQFAVPVPPEFYGSLSKMCSEGYAVQQAWAHPPAGGARQILTQVRTRLLQFALNLRDRVPTETSPGQLKDAIPDGEVRSLFNNAMNSNITVVVNSGSIGQLSSDVNVVNNEAALMESLAKLGITDDELKGLDAAIKADAGVVEHKRKSVGPAVANWIGETLKAATKAGVDALVKGAIHGYYGF